ncbi:hypothetical protein F4778DRAFT_325209 [Xylariomycetidae sp. FL2044]|nr:hypothetical protein F4778DRAFT_325209 [Xylariomycetidae sp. FL2044]
MCSLIINLSQPLPAEVHELRQVGGQAGRRSTRQQGQRRTLVSLILHGLFPAVEKSLIDTRLPSRYDTPRNAVFQPLDVARLTLVHGRRDRGFWPYHYEVHIVILSSSDEPTYHILLTVCINKAEIAFSWLGIERSMHLRVIYHQHDDRQHLKAEFINFTDTPGEEEEEIEEVRLQCSSKLKNERIALYSLCGQSTSQMV